MSRSAEMRSINVSSAGPSSEASDATEESALLSVSMSLRSLSVPLRTVKEERGGPGEAQRMTPMRRSKSTATPLHLDHQARRAVLWRSSTGLLSRSSSSSSEGGEGCIYTVVRVLPVVLAAKGTLLGFLEILVDDFFELDHLAGAIGERIRGRVEER